jgi:HEAT repeat protein
MTLKRLAILLAILIFLAGVGIAWLWQYAYTPEGRARVIIAQLKGDTSTFRGWLLQHNLIRPGFSVPSQEGYDMTQEQDRFAADTQIAAAEAMVKLGRVVQPIVIEALRDDNNEVQMAAIRACGKFRDPAAIGPLVDCMHDSFKSRDQEIAFKIESLCRDSLIEIGPEAYGPLLKASDECYPGVRNAIPLMLAGKWGHSAVPHLIGLLENYPGWVRACTAEELGVLKDPRASDALMRQLDLDENDPLTKIQAAKALGEIGETRAIPYLLRMLHKSKTHTTAPVAGVLARMGQEEGLKFFLTLAKSKSPPDRFEAARELGTKKIKGTLEPLLSMLSDKETYIRLQALRSIKELHDPRSLPAVGKLLNDPSVHFGVISIFQDLGFMPPPASQPVNR